MKIYAKGFEDITVKNIKKNANMFVSALDHVWVPDLTSNLYNKHLQDCIDYPTRGLIAKHQIIDRYEPFCEPKIIRNNKKYINQRTITKQLLKQLKEKNNWLYPTTQKARNYIAKTNRVEFDTVKKSKGYNIIDRIRILFTKV